MSFEQSIKNVELKSKLAMGLSKKLSSYRLNTQKKLIRTLSKVSENSLSPTKVLLLRIMEAQEAQDMSYKA